MLENYLSSYTNVVTCLLLVMLAGRSAEAQSPTKLIYTQQSGTSSSDKLLSASLTVTFPTSGLSLANDAAAFGQPNDVVFDPVNNYIYVVDNTLTTGPIVRYVYTSSSNTVSSRTIIVPGTSGATYQGLALDVPNNRLFFSQSSATNSQDALKVVTGLNGSTYTVTQLTDGQPTNGNFGNPRGLAFDPVNNFIYLIDQLINTGPILRFTVSSSTVSNRKVIVAGVGAGTSSAYGGLALDQKNDRLYFTQYRSSMPSVSNVEDALKVVSGVSGDTYTVTELINGSSAAFLFPQDLVLDRENNYLYLVDQVAGGGSIYRYSTTGTGQTQIVGAADASSSYGGVALNGGVYSPVSLNSSTPADNATGVSTTANIVLNFDRAVTKATGNFEIRRTSDNALIETINVTSSLVTGSGATWTINPSTTLDEGISYALRAASGIFKAADGGSYAGISDNTTLNFTTLVSNKTPTDIAISPSPASVDENQSSGTTVGIFSTTDPDAGQTFTYSLVSGTGSADNTSFQLVGNQLKTNATFDFETKNSYSIRVQTTDNGTPALSFQKSFTITVNNVNELVASIIAKNDVSCNGGSNGTANVVVTGESAPFSYKWRNTTTNTTLAEASSVVTGLTAGIYSVTVTATSSGFSATTSFTISQPTALSLTSSSTRVSTAGGSDGTATVSVSGGTPGYSYNWTPGNPTGDGTNAISGLSAGTYTVTVTDARSCTTATSVTITTVPDLSLVTHAGTTIIYGTDDISFVVEVYEINSVATSGTITVKVNKDAKIALTFDNALTMIGGRPVQNSLWSLAGSDENYYVLTSNQAIGAGDVLSFGLSGTFSAGNTSGSLTLIATAITDNNEETTLTNNTDTERIDFFQQ